MSRQNPQPPKESSLQLFWNRLPWLGARNMLPDTRATFDASVEWPLPIDIKNVHNNLVNGVAQDDVIASPARGRHIMVLRASVYIVAPSAFDQFQLYLQPAGATDANLAQIQFNAQYSNRFYIPIVGSTGIEGGTAFPPNAGPMIGCRPVYVPYGFELVFTQYTQTAAGSESFFNYTTVEYPETQPLTSLFNY